MGRIFLFPDYVGYGRLIMMDTIKMGIWRVKQYSIVVVTEL